MEKQRPPLTLSHFLFGTRVLMAKLTAPCSAPMASSLPWRGTTTKPTSTICGISIEGRFTGMSIPGNVRQQTKSACMELSRRNGSSQRARDALRSSLVERMVWILQLSLLKAVLCYDHGFSDIYFFPFYICYFSLFSQVVCEFGIRTCLRQIQRMARRLSRSTPTSVISLLVIRSRVNIGSLCEFSVVYYP